MPAFDETMYFGDQLDGLLVEIADNVFSTVPVLDFFGLDAIILK